MSLDFSGLSDLAANPTGGWALPVMSDVVRPGPPMSVLAFDQSLTSTGAVLVVRDSLMVRVDYSVTLRGGETEAKGFVHDYRRAIAIERQVRQRVAWVRAQQAMIGRLMVVHETPPVGSKRLPGAGSSSKAAGQAVWSACDEFGIEPVMLNSQQAKKWVCGNHKADKAEAHAALRQHVFPWLVGSKKITNEHERDAVLLALLALSKER